ncbi:MAG TPA: fused ferrous iron transport protein A/B [Syntrophomonadaceae bacterium]|jgi:ferrous iron transport protein B|nr:fused ferrous iron transport protein A/B [Syntrophomonadaceae bacterium]
MLKTKKKQKKLSGFQVITGLEPISPTVKERVDVTQLSNNQAGRVTEVQGGQQLVAKLENMGIVPGVVVVKKSSSLMKGPVVLEREGSQFAVGYGMAQGIMVEPLAANREPIDLTTKRVVLVGNPNVGKTLVFSRITGTGVVTGNYAGTTVEVVTGRFEYEDRYYELIDTPGIYSLDQTSPADAAVVQLVREADIILNIVDATNLERNLNLTLQLLQLGKPMLVCLNYWDETAHNGITIDVPALERILDVPVVTASALRNDGISRMVGELPRARISRLEFDSGERWQQIGRIVDQVQRLEHRHHTLWERLGEFTIHPIGGIVTALAALLATLFIVRFMGEGLIGVLEQLYADLYAPFIMNLVGQIPSDFIRGLLVGYSVDPLESFGILTSGLYIALVLVFPYFLSFYLLFGFLEDLGYLPRLAVVLDNIFHRLGLHGYSSIPVMLGLGCKVPAILSTRMLTNRRDKILTIALIMMSAPCLPQTAMIVSLGMNYSLTTVLFIFMTLVVLAFGMSILINRVLPGKPADFFAELPPYRVPSLTLMARKLWVRIAEYFSEVLPLIAVGVLVMSILDFAGVIEFLTIALQEPVELVLGLPPAIAPIMLLGFLRKDVSIALLAPLGLTAQQFIVASIFLVLYTPCVSSFFTMLRELGAGMALKIMGVVLAAAVTVTAVLHIVFRLVG